MTQEQKDLFLKDLCARLPYGVKLDTLEGPQELDIRWLAINMCNIASPYLPYLFPLSSMTEEEIKEYKHLVAFSGSSNGAANFTDWLNKNHFDYRGLIPMGLAIDATGLKIY